MTMAHEDDVEIYEVEIGKWLEIFFTSKMSTVHHNLKIKWQTI